MSSPESREGEAATRRRGDGATGRYGARREGDEGERAMGRWRVRAGFLSGEAEIQDSLGRSPRNG